MKATIDIKTPAGKSLEGFPITDLIDAVNVSVKSDGETNIIRYIELWEQERMLKTHPGDTITIRIEE